MCNILRPITLRARILKNLKFISSLFLLVFIVPFVACTEDKESEKKEDEDVLRHNVEEAKSIFYMLPSPIETASLLQKAGAKYDGSILNPVINMSRYELASMKALNLGVYGSDLSYASVFDQTQEVLFYLSSCKKLADGLGLEKAFDSETMKRMEENINNKDSLLQLISDSYWMADSYLKENERSNLSALIISGGWIEGVYIATKLAETSTNEALLARIAEQKLSLSHLLSIVETYKGDHGDVNDVYSDLLEINAIFNKMKSEKGSFETFRDSEMGITTIGGSSKLILSKSLLQEISTKIETIRNRYIE